jgi:hypothetical protein
MKISKNTFLLIFWIFSLLLFGDSSIAQTINQKFDNYVEKYFSIFNKKNKFSVNVLTSKHTYL